MSKMSRILFTGGAVFALGLTGFGTAAADTGSDDVTAMGPCAGGRVCMYEDANFGGDKWVDNAPGTCSQNMCDIDGWNGDNEISSIHNSTNCTVRLFADDDQGGRTYDVAKNSEIGNLETVGFDNDAESYQFFC